MSLALLAACARGLGADIDDWEDPADQITSIGFDEENTGRDRDPSARRADVTAFLAETGLGAEQG